jgi:uncharacterized protein YndB with AHSA1/START domain
VTSPLRITFDVACPAEHAFAMWTSRIGTWWPADHTVTGDRDVAIVLEGGVGGRIYERTADGAEYDWGVVTVWDPPKRLAYVPVAPRQDRSEATDVDIRFVARGPDDTRLEIEHRGRERLGATADA